MPRPSWLQSKSAIHHPAVRSLSGRNAVGLHNSLLGSDPFAGRQRIAAGAPGQWGVASASLP